MNGIRNNKYTYLFINMNNEYIWENVNNEYNVFFKQKNLAILFYLHFRYFSFIYS